MSFGFSVGDFLAVAQLAYTLGKALSDSKGAAKEYGKLIAELNVVRKVLLQVNELRAANQIARATVNALLFTVNSTNVAMEAFLDEHEEYEKSLKPGGSRNPVKDIYRKGKWATQTSDKVKDLRESLGTMLAAINCLLSLACYYNTGYDPRCTAYLSPNIVNSQAQHWKPGRSWKNLKVQAAFLHDYLTGTRYPGFERQTDPASFFRPGQIFAAQITSTLSLDNYRRFRNIDFGNLPLEPISKLETTAEIECLEDRTKRLAQIRQLPLEQMTHYCKDMPLERGKVECLLCPNSAWNSYSRDEWAAYHFRIAHWRQYLGIIPSGPHLHTFRGDMSNAIIPWKEQKLPQRASDSRFSGDKWITLDDVVRDSPIVSDEKIVLMVGDVSEAHHFLAGPVMIQRFVVVREGNGYCLCLGIHTYARRGCGSQPDQELFSVISSEKVPPPLQPDETGIVLSPVRMKVDHPSTTLPRTARIHFGRAYEIENEILVQPLGLVHPSSMETLLDQFEANVVKMDPEEMKKRPFQTKYRSETPDLKTQAADMRIVKDIRENITKVLGLNLSPADHKPPKGRSPSLLIN